MPARKMPCNAQLRSPHLLVPLDALDLDLDALLDPRRSELSLPEKVSICISSKVLGQLTGTGIIAVVVRVVAHTALVFVAPPVSSSLQP